MNKLSKFALINLMCIALPVAADDFTAQYTQQTSSSMQDLVKYVLNLGGYMGYDLTQNPTKQNQAPNQKLLNAAFIELTQNYVYNTFLGAIPVDAMSTALANFLPNNTPGSQILNPLANNTFNFQNYSSASTGEQGKFTVLSLIDQQNYQKDPVSQAVLNILATPDATYCMSYDASSWNSNCKLLYQNQVMSNIIGPLPSTYQYFTYDYNQKLISQLNSNSLTGPLMYSAENANQSTGSPSPNTENPGLTAQNQVQQAANFIRYVSGSVTPASLPKLKEYDNLFTQAVPPQGTTNVNLIQQMQAQATLTNYFTNLRSYAAQSSVGIANLYYILSKRLPQNQSGENQILTSQALSEFNMATWRLFNPNPNDQNSPLPSKQWIDQINGASSASVQKEIAVLLAEINYQMYLDRQLQERILLTNSILLLQNAKANQPSADFSTQNSSQ